jgi:hypothetical protein
MDRPSVFRAAHVDRLAMLGANRARANLFRYSASASRVSTKSNRFGAGSRKIMRRTLRMNPYCVSHAFVIGSDSGWAATRFQARRSRGACASHRQKNRRGIAAAAAFLQS